MRFLILTLFLISSCATANRIGFGAAAALTACDWRQTRNTASAGWDKTHTYEANPILGRAPSPFTVDVYMIDALIFAAVAYEVLPERYRGLLWIPLGIAEAETVVHNVGSGWSCLR